MSCFSSGSSPVRQRQPILPARSAPMPGNCSSACPSRLRIDSTEVSRAPIVRAAVRYARTRNGLAPWISSRSATSSNVLAISMFSIQSSRTTSGHLPERALVDDPDTQRTGTVPLGSGLATGDDQIRVRADTARRAPQARARSSASSRVIRFRPPVNTITFPANGPRFRRWVPVTTTPRPTRRCDRRFRAGDRRISARAHSRVTPRARHPARGRQSGERRRGR